MWNEFLFLFYNDIFFPLQKSLRPQKVQKVFVVLLKKLNIDREIAFEKDIFNVFGVTLKNRTKEMKYEQHFDHLWVNQDPFRILNGYIQI